MKSIRTFLIFGGLIAALAMPAASLAQTAPDQPTQPGAGAPQRGGMIRALAALNLTPDQKQKIDGLMAQFRQAHAQGSAPDPAARKTLHDQIFAVLTPDQQAQLNASLQASRGNQADRMMNRFAALNLSDDQKTRIQNLIAQFRQAHPPGSARDPQAMQALRAQINAILTPQQQQQLQSMRQNGGQNSGS